MLSQKYHNIFHYQLTQDELVKWQYKNYKETAIGNKNKQRIKNEISSKKKLIIAQKAANLISKVPTINFIGITGALAMMNASDESDIDLMIITEKNFLWTTRFVVLILLAVFQIPVRRASDRNEKDKLCLNMWFDESDLVWDKKNRNLYTAHEIAQIIPLINKDNTYEKFLYKNRWILNFWPNAIKIKNLKLKIKNSRAKIQFLEIVAYKLQYFYMSKKITREIVTPTRAMFHPNDWRKKVLTMLKIVD